MSYTCSQHVCYHVTNNVNIVNSPAKHNISVSTIIYTCRKVGVTVRLKINTCTEKCFIENMEPGNQRRTRAIPSGLMYIITSWSVWTEHIVCLSKWWHAAALDLGVIRLRSLINFTIIIKPLIADASGHWPWWNGCIDWWSGDSPYWPGDSWTDDQCHWYLMQVHVFTCHCSGRIPLDYSGKEMGI